MPPLNANYDETKVPPYSLPDPLVCLDGTPVTSTDLWRNRRRPEILELFFKHVYGRMPGCPESMRFDVTGVDRSALAGQATRKEITATLAGNGHQVPLRILLYTPNHVAGPVPAFVGLNFHGNHTVLSDPGVALASGWMRDAPNGLPAEELESRRGSAASTWQVLRLLERGYGLATAYCGDIDPDYHDGFTNGVHALFPRDDSQGDAWGTIGAWAWGLSRILDYLETDDSVDAGRIAVTGLSRLGKTAIWAGAVDERFALAISTCSGCGGASLSKRIFGETVGSINERFPHWFCTNFKAYNNNEHALPLDQHMLLALVAPRPVYVSSAEEDLWADPRGEFLATLYASPVYELLGRPGLPVREMPPVSQPAMGAAGYHIRPGGHNCTAYDWECYLDFADLHLKG